VVTVADLDGITVEHCVTINFTRWVERKDGSPRDVTDDDKVRAIFGLPR